jgi:hypothetical protein
MPDVSRARVSGTWTFAHQDSSPATWMWNIRALVSIVMTALAWV